MLHGIKKPCNSGYVFDEREICGLVLTKSGKQHDGLFALGSMVSGTYFWTNAMNVNCRLADGVAREIIDRSERLHHGYQNIAEQVSSLETMIIEPEAA